MDWVALLATIASIILFLIKYALDTDRKNKELEEKARLEREAALRAQADRERAEAQRAAQERDALIDGESEYERHLRDAINKGDPQ